MASADSPGQVGPSALTSTSPWPDTVRVIPQRSCEPEVADDAPIPVAVDGPVTADGGGAPPSHPGDAVYPARWEIDAFLADGSAVHVRPIHPSDADALVRFHEGLSATTVRRRYFTPHAHLTEREVRRFTTVDHRDRVAMVGWRGDDIVGIGRYDRTPGGDDAEVAFVVDDALQGRGLGTLLLRHLAGAAVEHGIRRFTADTLFENHAMLRVFRDAGYRETTRLDHGVVAVQLDLDLEARAATPPRARGTAANLTAIGRDG